MSFAPLPTEESVEKINTETHVFESRKEIEKGEEKET